MGTSTVWQVTWNADLARYQISEQAGQGKVVSEMKVDGDAWREWLERVSSFAFQSKEGVHITALKEHRGGGRVYWIAYRKIGGKLKRKYLGPSERGDFGRVRAGSSAADANGAHDPFFSFPFDPFISCGRNVAPSSERVPAVPADHQGSRPGAGTHTSSPSSPLRSTGRRYPTSPDPRFRPAGFGKTSLLESWVQSRLSDSSRVAWVSLDEGDNDVVRFWMYVLAALETCEPGISQQALTLLHAPQALALDTVLTRLLNQLSQTTTPLVLILDDYHVIKEPVIHTMLNFLLEHQPHQLHLLLSTRSEPPLKLSRFRARGLLLEVHDDDLRCSTDEARQFLGEVMESVCPRRCSSR